ncbi:small GTP-binding isoform B [Chlorella sorokiniana]|uniref:Small GTP-binding isoform B n=1 Tax=Chlorella sorokiniana TaxID=3076 RepID=A0A2P6TK84_CHLSO|nr:small GTP-binding isoform B [Chlorella sorokiniana]|eukprot:PRW44486.1 small GTP-binding isoform B [Chlorella sorokiniana]
MEHDTDHQGGPDPLTVALARLKAGRPPRSPERTGGDSGSDGDLQAAAAQLQRAPPRQSSDSTLQPPPSGRPSSAPSHRSSFDSYVEGATSDPSRSQRSSLEQGSPASLASAPSSFRPSSHAPPMAPALAAAPPLAAAALAAGAAAAGADASADGADSAAALGATDSGNGFASVDFRPLRQNSGETPTGRTSPFATSSLSLPMQPAKCGEAALHSPFSPSGSAHFGQQTSRPRGHRAGRDPVNLEHGSTAPPGAVDALAEALAAAVTSQQGGGGSGAGPTGAARFAPPRRAAGSRPPASPPTEPLLSSQVALLAQQLLLHRQQGPAASSATAAAQLRRSLQLQESWPGPPHAGGAPPRPLMRSRTVAAEELLGARGRTGLPSAAQQLMLSGGGGDMQYPQASAALRSLDPAHQPRFSNPASPPSEEASPFSAVQGVYGCHLLPPVDHADPHSPEPSPGLVSRSSIDLLLDPMLPASARNHRHSIDTLSELLRAPAQSGLGSPTTSSAARLMQQLVDVRAAAGMATGSAPGSNAVRARVPVRHSMDGASRQLESMARSLTVIPGARRTCREVVDPAASYYGHLLSSGSMHDLANSTVTVVAGVVPTAAQAQQLASRAAASAHASSMVDPAAAAAEASSYGGAASVLEESFVDPDIHDTFGAHPSYPTAARRPHTPASSNSSPLAAAAALRAGASGSAGKAAAAGGAAANGWRQPLGAPRPAGTAAAGAVAAAAQPSAGQPAPSAAAARAVAAGTAVGHPTVYPAHPKYSPAMFSPIGHTMMLDPTNVPGQHSITVNDPQIVVPSLQFLKQRALARQKLERLDQQGASTDRGGYIAEAKRVLAAAVHTASAQEAAVVESSCSGAIGPLLRYLQDNKHDDAALRSGLHTLSLLVSNSPNRGIIVSFQGQAMLCEAMRATWDLEIRENIVQLLWDLEAGQSAECHFEPDDILALLSVLEATTNAVCINRPDQTALTPEQMQLCAQRLVQEIAAHKHHLQDAAQYTLGNLTAVVLGADSITSGQREQMVTRLLDELRRSNTPGQCQVVLTVLSCLAGNARLRSSMARCRARRRLVDFGQRIPDPRLRARSLSLVKILHKQEALESTCGEALPPVNIVPGLISIQHQSIVLMALTRRGKASASGPKAGVRKPAAKVKAKAKPGAVVTKSIVFRRSGSSKGAGSTQAAKLEASAGQRAAAGQAGQPDQERDDGQGPIEQQREQQPAAGAKRRRSTAAAAGGGGDQTDAIIDALSAEALQEVFLNIGQEQQSYCREILPLVCKRFRDVLLDPSCVWENLHIDFIQKGLDLAFPQLQQPGDGDGLLPPDGANRRLLHSAVERWLKPRAAAVKRLVLSFSARDSTHSFPKSGHGLRRIFGMVAASLQELSICQCSDIFHAKSFADLAQLQALETLAITFMAGKVTPADLAPLSGLRNLSSLTLSASRTHEEAGENVLGGFPDSLLKLKGLTSLAVSSLGVTNLPVGITKLKNLTCLDVSGCPLAFLPSQLWKLSALRHLRLNGTSLMVGLTHTWEPLTKMPALESVELRDLKAVQLPPHLTGMSSLTSLDLSDNYLDAAATLEDGLGALASLPNLQRLKMRCCQLPSVPAQICNLTRLTHLDLSRNQLVELPPSLSAVSTLQELVAEGNCFPRIPQVLAQLPHLEVADLSFNIYMEAAASLAPLTADGGLAALRRLDVRKMLGVWKDTSIPWLEGLVAALQQRHGERGGSPGSAALVLWD